MSEHAHMTEEQAQAAHEAKIVHDIQAKFNNLVDVKDFKFSFRKDDLGNRRNTVDLKLPVPSVEGIVDLLQHADERPKELQLLLDAIQDVIATQARSIVNDQEDISQENFPLDQVSWTAIANMPEVQRRGGGISKEIWEAFSKDYIEVMPAVTGKTKEQVTNAAKIYLNKFNAVKTQKPVLAKLKEQLTIYLTTTPNAETYEQCVSFLTNKIDNLMQIDEAALLANL